MENYPILHSQMRLAVVSLLMGVETAGFTWIREQTGASAGNLSVQLTRLREAGYKDRQREFRKNIPGLLFYTV